MLKSISQNIEKLKYYDFEAAAEFESIKTQEECIQFLNGRGFIGEHSTNLIDLWSIYCRQYEELILLPKEIKRFAQNMLEYARRVESTNSSHSLSYTSFKNSKASYFKKLANDAEIFLLNANRELTFTRISLNGASHETQDCDISESFKINNIEILSVIFEIVCCILTK